MNRFFILAVRGFPRGGPAANYVQYLAQALSVESNKVIVLGIGTNREEDEQNHKYYYRNIEYNNGVINNSLVERLGGYNAQHLNSSVEKYCINEDDYAIIYGTNFFLLKWAVNNFQLSHIAVCQVEKYQPYQFKFGRINPRFMLHRYTTKLLQKRKIKVLPISSNIAGDYPDNSMILPIMSDPYEYGWHSRVTQGGVRRFIYPGIKATDFEDDIPTLLQALEQLSLQEKEMLEIHFTGITREQFIKRYPVHNKFEDLNVMFHGWLKYSELIELYKEMDYMLLVRKINETTKANFPSKIPELMSFGVIPICTRVGDYTQHYLQDGVDSIHIKTTHLKDCIDAIRKAIYLEKETQEKMSNAARRLSIERFFYQKWSTTLIQFLTEK